MTDDDEIAAALIAANRSTALLLQSRYPADPPKEAVMSAATFAEQRRKADETVARLKTRLEGMAKSGD